MAEKYKITTIKLDKDTKGRLDKLKAYKRETYDDVIRKILSILNLCKADPYDAKEKLEEIDVLRRKQGKP